MHVVCLVWLGNQSFEIEPGGPEVCGEHDGGTCVGSGEAPPLYHRTRQNYVSTPCCTDAATSCYGALRGLKVVIGESYLFV